MLQIVGMVLGGLVAIQIGLLLIGLIVHPVLSKGELEQVPVYGQMVAVNGQQMHVHAKGHGEATVVLLPGFGVALPAADFGPLMRALSIEHTVVAVDYFGVGFSDPTDVPRTNDNYVKEIRAALANAGFSPPYILMPHSASGIYAEYYAHHYPEEIQGVVMLDTTSTADIPKAPPAIIYWLARLQGRSGLNRINSRLIRETRLVENGYTEKEIADHRLYSYHAINDTMIDQMRRLGDSIVEVNGLEFPDTIPVLKLISTETIRNMAKHNKDDGMGYQHEHLRRLGEHAAFEILDGSHLIYQTKAEDIAAISTRFIENISLQ